MMTDAVSRVQQIQSTLGMLAAPAVRAASSSTTAAGAGTTAGTSSTSATTRTAQTAPATPGGSAAGTSKNAVASGDLFADALAEATAPAVVEDVAPAPAADPAPDVVPAPSSSDVDRVIAAAKAYEGVPYVWGGTDPAVGLDCSGFLQRAYADIGIEIPRVTWDQMNAGTQVSSLAEAQPGDLLFSFDGGHVSMYLGGGKAIDAPQPGSNVAVRDMWETDANITTIRRILPGGSASVAPAPVSAATAPVSDPAVDEALATQAAFLASMAR
ncbi:C40 family peptidase [uncultured Arthrobacter sp.]|uniref:C40 family peptidase n=1 Tax=uncultured Arthrobacter sp. TaxID=114050 RepID=UPI002638157D|nr:C40 family peptidase [uncultured Arthrobacter sp.]